jgi:hypothetical protein
MTYHADIAFSGCPMTFDSQSEPRVEITPFQIVANIRTYMYKTYSNFILPGSVNCVSVLITRETLIYDESPSWKVKVMGQDTRERPNIADH